MTIQTFQILCKPRLLINSLETPRITHQSYAGRVREALRSFSKPE